MPPLAEPPRPTSPADWPSLMASAGIGAIVLDGALRIVHHTAPAAVAFALREDDLGRPLAEVPRRVDYPELERDLSDALRTSIGLEREVRTEDGRWLLARLAPDPGTQGLVFTLLDATARRAAEERLRSTEQRMALVTDSMRDFSIITMDPHGTIVTWSPGAEKIFGYAPHEAVGQPFAVIFTEEDRAAGQPAEELRKAREHGRAADDRWHRRRDGSRVYCSGITTPLGSGHGEGFAKIARDFTLQELEEARRNAALIQANAASERLREANALKDRFLAVVSHELKNPLSTIQINAQVIGRTPACTGDPQATGALRAIVSAVASQSRIIDELLDLSRANMAKIELVPQRLDLAEIVRGIVSAAAVTAAARHQSLTSEIQSTRIVADPVRLEQIVWNLVGNALKFTPDGGAIRVRLGGVDGSARLVVEDDGIGLEPSQLVDIFGMFRQVESDVPHGGLGIGLALVKRLVDLHGGEVEATSPGLGRGARFEVRLPLAGHDAQATAPAEARARALDGLRLLIVDDDADQQSALATLLRLDGATTQAAPTAEAALAEARARPFDAIVSDIAMPDHDGHWLARALREDPATRTVVLIAASGMDRPGDRARALASGYDALVGKPLDVDVLREAIVQALRQRRTAGG